MSGQYPPPNPGHPFPRAALHQRPAPGQSLLPPWGHTPQPSGMNMVGSTMNFYGSPHVGLPNRGAQPWLPHPKPPDTRPAAANPLFGLQMLMTPEGVQRIPSEYQQEETMDLSSHSSTPSVPDMPKISSARTENSDTLRNGTIVVPEVNGDVERTESEVKDSVVTSVIASNPLRENFPDTLNCSKVSESSVVKKADAAMVPESLVKSVDMFTNPAVDRCANIDTDVSTSEPVQDFVSSVPKVTASSIESFVQKEAIDSSRLLDSTTEYFAVETEQDPEASSKTVGDYESVRQNVDSLSLMESQSSYHENSSLSLDTDDSKLVVAESSADDIFGISPVNETLAPSSQVTDEDESNETPLTITEMVPDKTTADAALSSVSNDPWSIASRENGQQQTNRQQTTPALKDSEPHPSVENVEILLESMFNSQEEASFSSQNSNSGVPQSVIVSNGAKVPAEVMRAPVMDLITPMKEEELAMTLAEDNPIVAEVKDEVKEERHTEDFMDEIEKKLEMLTESGSSDLPVSKTNDQAKMDSFVPESVKKEPDSRNNSDGPLLTGESNVVEKQAPSVLLADVRTVSKSEIGSSSNPFIEVETELEKMFAGIVEPTDEMGSDSQTLPLVSEPKRPAANKKSVTKRKKANSRRPSDHSVFGGSSEDITPVKKKRRKRVNDSGSEGGSKKIKSEILDSLKKGKVPKDASSDNLGKVKGPFVHIEGSKESPASVVVVNSGLRADDEDGADKASARRKHSTMQRSGATRRAGPAYSSSTLSMRYNSDTADLTWVCVFCKRGPHCAGGLGTEPAGDLFGPYRVPATRPGDDVLPLGTPADKDVVEEQKKRGGKYAVSLRASGAADHFIQKMGKKNKRSQSTDSCEPQPGLLAVDGGYEVWLHGPCAEWAPGLCVIGSQLVGLDDAVWTALRTKCSQCGESGASVGCVVRNCSTRVHYHCAVTCGWLLDPDTYIARCNAHRTRLRPT